MPWSIFLMASVSALLMYQNKSLERQKRKQIAEKISSQVDPSNERILAVALTQFTDFFKEENFKRFYNENDNRILKNSIINTNFHGYLNNFDTRIYTYDSAFIPKYNDDSISYNVIKSILINQSRPTEIQNLYYYENTTDKFSYIFEKDVRANNDSLLGYIFLVIQPKTSKDVDLEPQLFKQLIDETSFIERDYAYAIYQKYHLLKSTSNRDFIDTISVKDVPKMEYEYKNKNGYSELWYNTRDNKVVVVARKNNWFSESITFFAYLFGLFIVLVLILHFGNLVLKTHFKWEELKKVFRFNIRTQIQTIIVAVTVISFIVIGIVMITFFIARFNRENDEKLKSTSRVMVNEIEQIRKNQVITDELFGLKNLDLKQELEKRIVEIAETHNADLNFYDVSGNLQITTQEYIYDNHILSRKMNADAYMVMDYQRSTQYIKKEKLVDFSYVSIYVPVKNEDGSTFAYLNIPYINSQNELIQEISNFIITLVNLNALIFILAGGIAIWITNRITSSFTFIGSKMKAISFGSVNEEIEWKKNDELGELVSEYNKMVKKLSESAEALARSEREGAWREMARQVAHEIKNPLTPMKLSIQYLQKAIHNNASNVKALSVQVAHTLVEQIDQLSKIAGDFSQFANITNVKNELFDLTDVLETIIRLFNVDERINILWTKEKGIYTVEADRAQMNRLLTNLIKNAIEAYPTGKKAKIIIQQKINQNQLIISVEDHGQGIPINMQPKIFTPNFTTKSSGTGLGLAMCKGIVEKADGDIWFETEENEGTTFFVSLPLAHI